VKALMIRLTLWLAGRLGIPLIDRTKVKATDDAIARATQWEIFYREEGGLADMLEEIRREAFEVAGELDPSETDKIYYWAMADRNVRKLQSRIEAVIQTGQIEVERKDALARMNIAAIRR
jgi:hypothetical protein